MPSIPELSNRQDAHIFQNTEGREAVMANIAGEARVLHILRIIQSGEALGEEIANQNPVGGVNVGGDNNLYISGTVLHVFYFLSNCLCCCPFGQVHCTTESSKSQEFWEDFYSSRCTRFEP